MEVRAAVEEHLAAFNAHDTRRLLAGFAADAVWNTGRDVARGTAELAELFDDWLWSLRPSLETRSLLVDGDRAAAQLVERLTVDGAEQVFAIGVFFHVRDGLIVSGKVYREGSADLEGGS
jgi:ketosteroid isomerase-like protein